MISRKNDSRDLPDKLAMPKSRVLSLFNLVCTQTRDPVENLNQMGHIVQMLYSYSKGKCVQELTECNENVDDLESLDCQCLLNINCYHSRGIRPFPLPPPPPTQRMITTSKTDTEYAHTHTCSMLI